MIYVNITTSYNNIDWFFFTFPTICQLKLVFISVLWTALSIHVSWWMGGEI